MNQSQTVINMINRFGFDQSIGRGDSGQGILFMGLHNTCKSTNQSPMRHYPFDRDEIIFVIKWKVNFNLMRKL